MNLQTSGLRFLIILLQMDVLSKIIMLILLALSVYSWMVIIEKCFKFRLLDIKTNNFEKLFWSGEEVENIYEKTKNAQKSPNSVVFSAAMQEYTGSNIQEIIKSNSASKKEAFKERIYNTMIVAGRRATRRIRSGVMFLFVSSTISLFLGLLGTIWGLMQTFKTISLMKEANLATIAPGIGSALLVMMTSMLCSLPSLAAYHIFGNRVNNSEEELDNFVLEVLTILSREL